MKSIRIGAISWDCSLPSSTYFGYYQTRTLSPSKHRCATPYYADILEKDKIEYHYRNQNEFDRELMCVKDAGIDYLAYVFYPDEGSRNHSQTSEKDCSHKVYELNYARHMHESSSLKNEVGIAAIVGAHPFTDRDISELVELMSKPYYETVEQRPLVYFFGGLRAELSERLRCACADFGLPDPFIVPMYNEGCKKGCDLSSAQAISAYANIIHGIDSYHALAEDMIAKNQRRLDTGLPVIPLYSVGWDPAPRVDIPSPWVDYPKDSYAPFATEKELMRGAQMLTEWICKQAKEAFIGHILTFAWNEFEEGGYICPTYDPNGNINTSRLTAFQKVSSFFKENLGS